MHRPSDQSGFSLFELMVVMGVMLIVTGATMGLMRNSVKVSNVTYELSNAQQNLRTAHEQLNRDLVTAGDGLLGINNIRVPRSFVLSYLSQSLISDCTTTVCPLTVVTSDNDVPVDTTVPGFTPTVKVLGSSTKKTDRLTILQMDQTFTPVSLVVGTITSNTNGYVVTVPTTAIFNSVSVNDVYFFTSSAGQTLGTVTAKTGTNQLQFNTTNSYTLNTTGTTGSLRVVAGTPASGASTLPVSMMQLQVIHYFVGDDGILYRRVFGSRDVAAGSGYRDNVIAEHVTDLQFRYILRATGSSTPSQPVVAQLTTGLQQAAVRQVEVTVTTETTKPIVNGQRQEVKMTTSTAIRNVLFREADRGNSIWN